MRVSAVVVCLLVACHGATTKPTVPVAPADPPPTATLRLEGQVIDRQDAPVAGATIELSPSARTTTSEADGSFAFDGLAAGPYTLTASVPGLTGVASVSLSETSDPVLLRVVVDDDTD